MRRAAMTETEWLTSHDPGRMLVRLGADANERKLRLFAAACCRSVWHLLPDARSRRAVETAERCAAGQADAAELEAARVEARRAARAADRFRFGAEEMAEAAAHAEARSAALAAARYTAITATQQAGWGWDWQAAWEAGCIASADLLREIFGNPFRPAEVRRSWLSYGGGLVPELAAAIETEQAYERLPILADALEEAGCDDVELLAHLRGAGPHVPGCWALDLLLSKA